MECCGNCAKRNDAVLTSSLRHSPRALGSGIGACHHYENDASVLWLTHEDDWCGEWEPRLARD